MLSRSRPLVIAVIALVVALGGLSATPASAATTATVQGVVTVDGVPTAGLLVQTSPPSATGGEWPQATTDSSGHYSVAVQVDPDTGTNTLEVTDPADGGSHVVPVDLTIRATAGQQLTQNVVMTRFDARLVAAVSRVPAGVSGVSIGATRVGADLGGSHDYVAGQPTEVDGLASGAHVVAAYLNTTSGGSTSTTGWLYYPNHYYTSAPFNPATTPVTLTAGCTTFMTVDLTARTMTLTGRDCARLPACQSAAAAAATAVRTLAAKTKAVAVAKKKYKKAKKHHASKKKLKKLKKRLKKATAAKKRYAGVPAAAAATAQRTCH